MSRVAQVVPFEPSDRQLLEGCVRQQQAALAQLFDRHFEGVLRFIRRMVFDAAEAEDLAQQTFVVAYERASSFSGGAEVKTWLFGIASNLSRKHLRFRFRTRRAKRSWQESQPPSTKTPESQVELQRQLIRLDDLVQALPAKQREVYLLTDVEGISGVEVAALLKIPAGTVWRRLHEARKKLREGLNQGASA